MDFGVGHNDGMADVFAMMYVDVDEEFDDGPQKPLPDPPKAADFNRQRVLHLSLLIVVVGLACISLEVVKSFYYVSLFHSEVNIYLAILVPVTGLLGVLAARRPRQWIYVFLLYLIIPTAIASVVILVRNGFIWYYLRNNYAGFIISVEKSAWENYFKEQFGSLKHELAVYYGISIAAVVSQSVAVVTITWLGYYAFKIFQVACAVCRDKLGVEISESEHE